MNKALTLNPPFILKRTLSLNWKIYLKIFWGLSVLSILTLLVFYIFQVNSEASGSYLIQKYEKKFNELSIENKNLEISSSQLNSLDNIIASLEGLNLERVNKTYYIRVLDTKVVTK